MGFCYAKKAVSTIGQLTEKQKRFADEYLIGLNATQAAIRAGYSEKTAGKIGGENLKKPEIKNYIEKRLAEMKSQRTADAKEVLETLTAILRGEVTEETPLLCGEGRQTMAEKNTAVKDRLKAAELLGKRYGLFDRQQETAGGAAVAEFLNAIRPTADMITSLFAQEDADEKSG